MKLALIGEHLGHSLSPRIHALYSQVTGKSCEYQLIEMPPDRIELLPELMLAQGLRGANVTIPYKKTVMPLLDEISPAARQMGAVNTLAYRGKAGFAGDNTDAGGFSDMLDWGGIDPRGRRAAILGATGGAAQAVKWALEQRGAHIIEVGRKGPVTYQQLEDMEFDLLINCTPLGMWPRTEDCPAPEKVIRRARWAVDLIYNPEETRFLRLARQGGAKTLNGLYMLAAQAVRAQAIWRQEEYDPRVTREVYERLVTS